MNYELVMYARTNPCPYVRTAKRVLEREAIPYREILIDQDPAAEQRHRLDRVQVGADDHRCPPGEDLPFEEPAPLTGDSPRNIDRGSMITEPGEITFENWLRKHASSNSRGRLRSVGRARLTLRIDPRPAARL